MTHWKSDCVYVVIIILALMLGITLGFVTGQKLGAFLIRYITST